MQDNAVFFRQPELEWQMTAGRTSWLVVIDSLDNILSSFQVDVLSTSLNLFN
jgi:hypothetical protein